MYLLKIEMEELKSNFEKLNEKVFPFPGGYLALMLYIAFVCVYLDRSKKRNGNRSGI